MRTATTVSTWALIACLLPIGGCSGSAVSVSVSKDSVVALLKSWPDLKAADVESCKYEIEQTTANGWVPSPADTQTELKGSVILTESGSARLKAEFTWVPIDQDQLPADLAAIGPSGDLLTSSELNQTFTKNSRYPWGFVVLVDDAERRTAYFLVKDRDHPIK